MAKTSRDAYRHVQALSEFFSTGGVSREAMEEILKKSKKRKYLKQSVRRLVERGFIKSEGGNLSPTAKGFLLFRRFHKPKGQNQDSFKKWDGKWRLVTFDVPCVDDKRRYQIRSLLKEFDFCQLQKSVWICPTSLSENFWKIMVKEELDNYCKMMVVDFMEGDEELRHHFRLA